MSVHDWLDRATGAGAQSWGEIADMQPTMEDIAAEIDPDAARLAVARIMVTLGSDFDWSSDQLEDIATIMSAAIAGTNLPSIFDQDEDALNFWQSIP